MLIEALIGAVVIVALGWPIAEMIRRMGNE